MKKTKEKDEAKKKINYKKEHSKGEKNEKALTKQ